MGLECETHITALVQVQRLVAFQSSCCIVSSERHSRFLTDGWGAEMVKIIAFKNEGKSRAVAETRGGAQ